MARTNKGQDDQRFTQLWRDIVAGEQDEPSLFAKDGLAFARWKRNNAETVDEIQRIARARQGVAPVAYEDAYTGLDRHGYSGFGSGRARAAGVVRRYQTATSLGAGWQPNTVGAPAPMIGVPLGRHVVTGADIGFDALSWFESGIISNPSVFVMSLPGLGKSTFIRKILMGHVAQGHVPIIAGDVKAEYVGFTEQNGGQVIKLGPGIGHINPLDAGALGSIIPILEANRDQLEERGELEIIDRVREKVHHRQVSMVASLMNLGRAEKVADYETMLVSSALREMQDESGPFNWDRPPLLKDLIEQLEQGSEQLRRKAQTKTDQEWSWRVTPLLLSLNSLLDGQTGQIFGGHTTTPIDVDSKVVCMDVSAVERGDASMKAAVILSAWGSAFGAVEAAHLLSDVGLRKQKYFALTLDEMWQTLGAAPGLVERVDELSRLGRTDATAMYEITHTSKDLSALPTEEDRQKAEGFIERAGAVVCGGLPISELDLLQTTLQFTPAEADRIASWSRGAPPQRTRSVGRRATPPGRGRFMIKPSKDGAAGIPLQTILTQTELDLDLHNTNVRFRDLFDGARLSEGIEP